MAKLIDFLQGVGRAAKGGLCGFIGGLAVHVVAEAGQITTVAETIPVQYILPVFVIGGIALGFADGLMPEFEEEE